MTAPSNSIFMPREGALIDLQACEALASSIQGLAASWADHVWPGSTGLVLEGLDLEGDPGGVGPPGTKRFTAGSEGVTVSSGVALLQDRAGQWHRVVVEQPVSVAWPTASGAATIAALVLTVDVEQVALDSGISVARAVVRPRVDLLSPEHPLPHGLVLARSHRDRGEWTTDHQRMLPPSHTTVGAWDQALHEVERSIWTAEPDGPLWERQVLGRAWLRYQAQASAVVAAARSTLATAPTTTLDRVRIVRQVRQGLAESVEAAVPVLDAHIGPPEAAGPFRVLYGEDA